jgi:hypothetical protein
MKTSFYIGAWLEGQRKASCFAGVAHLAEQLTCNQQVMGSIPIASSLRS